ncbi:MAG: right-handed parallel beta-helix repeat-containing protein, partial [bacterium]
MSLYANRELWLKRMEMLVKKLGLGLLLLSLLAAMMTATAEEYRTGCLKAETTPPWIHPSPDIKLEREFDTSCDNSTHLPPVGSQGGQGSCTAWAVGYYYKTYQEWQEHGWDVTDWDHRSSPAFIYNQINGGADYGSYFEDAFKVLTDFGCASWTQMPYTDQNCTNLPDEEDYFTALPYRSQQTYSISLFSGNLTNLKNHLLNGNVAVIGILVYGNFDNISNYNYTYCVSEVYGEIRGGHAVTVCGFDDARQTSDGMGAFKVANSWGQTWGDGGYFWMSYEAMSSPVISYGQAYYCSDRIDYEPTIVAMFHVDHTDRYAIEYQFGIGSPSAPLWSQHFGNWYMGVNAAVSYPTSSIVMDLSDGAALLNPTVQNQLYMRCTDNRSWNSQSGAITDLALIELTWPALAVSANLPVPIPDNGANAYAYAELSQGSSTPVSGNVSGIWSAANNPYYVMGDVTVPSGTTLTIEPGVQVLFQGLYSLQVMENAVLSAVGNAQDSISFGALNPITGWQGIHFLGASSSSRLEFCKIQHGKALEPESVEIGGAILCQASHPTIANCTIKNCQANYGGAIACYQANPIISNNAIEWNEAAFEGGGIHCAENSAPAINNNIIKNNQALLGGGIYCHFSNASISENSISYNLASKGGGLYLLYSDAEISDNSIAHNTANQGGGFYVEAGSPTVQGNIIADNNASSGGAIYLTNGTTGEIAVNEISGNEAVNGGGIYCHLSLPLISLNQICQNSASNGGGILIWGSAATLTGNELYSNQVNGFGGGIYCISADPLLENNIVRNNFANRGA